MLRHSFIHLPGVGEQTEQSLWAQGFQTWDDLSDSVYEVFSTKKAPHIAEALEESRAAFDAQEFRYFQTRLKSAQMWRLTPECMDAVAYIDIESTGLGFPPVSHSTTIAVLFRGELFIEFEKEKKRRLLERIQEEARLIVSFNGSGFDLPFLRREFGLPLENAHLDLMIWLRRLGLKGGLKKIQLALPEIPQRTHSDIDGFDAVRLWRMHLRGVPNALETLMTYNAEDTLVLEPLLHYAWKSECSRLEHLPLRELLLPKAPSIPTQVDHYVYGLLRGEEEWQVPAEW